MKLYKRLSPPKKILLILFFLCAVGFCLHLLKNNPENILFQILSFICLFLSLYTIFNSTEIKIYNKIFMGLGLGVLAGLLLGDIIEVFQPVGKAFIQMIKMRNIIFIVIRNYVTKFCTLLHNFL